MIHNVTPLVSIVINIISCSYYTIRQQLYVLGQHFCYYTFIEWMGNGRKISRHLFRN